VPNGIGQRLREARAARGLALADVQARTKIRSEYLRAMEEERWEALPGSAYARAFLRTYGNFLGLDGPALANEYAREHAADEPDPAAGVRQIQLPERRAPRIPRPSPRRGTPRPATTRPALRWRGIAVAAVAAIIGIALVVGLTRDSDDGGERAETKPAASGAPDAPATTATTTPPQVALRLTATGTVWVCLVDDEGKPVIEGITLTAGEEQGPFRADAFEMTFGNGQVEMEANGDPVSVRPAAEPLGYRVTAEETKELTEASRPTCV